MREGTQVKVSRKGDLFEGVAAVVGAEDPHTPKACDSRLAVTILAGQEVDGRIIRNRFVRFYLPSDLEAA